VLPDVRQWVSTRDFNTSMSMFPSARGSETVEQSPVGMEPRDSSARLRIQAEVSHALASVVTDYGRLIETIVRSAADLMGDGCQIFLVSDDGLSLINAANAHREAAVESDVRNFLAGPPQRLATSQMMSAHVARTGDPKLLAEIDPDTAAARTDNAVKLLVVRVRIHSAVLVPVRARGRVIGTLSLIRTRAGCSYTSDDLMLLQDIADRAGLAIENARLYDDLERRVRERTAELEAINGELEAFSYSVAHDLRAPLRGIDAFSLALLEDCADKLDDVGKKYLGYVRDSAQRMAHLIDDLLTLSRVTRSELQRKIVDLSALARRVIARFEDMQPGRRIEIAIQDGVVCEGDAALLAVVLDNLLGNAWKFTVKRSAARIEFGVQAADCPPVFFVRDNGVGFDMASASKLFGVFERMHSVEEFEGTGIGLATVQRIVRRHGGRVWGEAAVGQGTTIYFTLEGETAGHERSGHSTSGGRSER
jgi:signal transduction histidine kinase